MQDETELIRAAATGDRSAFDTLVRLKRDRVARTAYQITGDWEDALDVAQGVFVRLWRNLDRFDSRKTFDTWLYRITVNAAIDWLRSCGPRGLIQPLTDEAAERVVDVRPSAEAAVDTAELQRAFLRLASQLAPKQRTAFVLREIEGQDTAEVARIMGVAESTVRNHLLQARRVLRRGLERDYPGLVPPVLRGGGDPANGNDRS
jgi:RNA polymerase sigma-70 factor (ECF subfamily)